MLLVGALLLGPPTAALAQPWTSLGPEGGTVRSLAIDPADSATVYAGTEGGGVFKSTNAGVTWSPANGGLSGATVYAILLDPVTPGLLYAGGSRGVFKSTDHGTTWAAMNTGLPSSTVHALVLDPASPATIYAGMTAGVFKTTNGGASWSAANTGLTGTNVNAIAPHPSDSNTLYAAVYGGGVFKTTNAGTSWSAASTGLTSTSVYDLAIDPAEPATLYVAAHGGGVFKTTDAAVSWSAANTGLSSPYVYALAVNPSAPATLYVTTLGGGIFKTTDGGENWSVVADLYAYALALDPTAPGTVYVGNGGDGVYKTTNAGASWTAVNAGLTGLTVNALAIHPADGDRIYIATDGGGGHVRATGGAGGWDTLPVPNWAYALAINPVDPATIYLGTNQGIRKTTNGGVDWHGKSSGLTTSYVTALAIHPTAPDTVYAGTGGGGVFKTTTGGDAWSAVNTGLGNLSVHALALHPTSPETIYAGTGTDVFKTTDGGTSWAAAGTGMPSVHVYALAIDPNTPGVVYAGSLGGVYKTTDGGDHWTAANAGLTSTQVYAVAVHPHDPTVVYAGTAGGGVFRSTDAAVSWEEINEGFTSLYTQALAFDPTNPVLLYAGTTNSLLVRDTNTAPAVPTARAQLKADGTTLIGLGGIAPPPTVVFRATVSDPDAGQQVRLQVEVKPIGAAFTGAVSCQSGFVSSGTAAACSRTGLVTGRYHWRLRAVDRSGVASPWASYATNAETAADFIVSTVPALPTARGQLEADGATAIPLGTAVPPQTVIFRGAVSDADAGQRVRLQVEVKPTGAAFTGAVSCQSGLVNSGTATTCPVPGLATGSYHWRLRAVDNLGAASAWVSYAKNVETDADFAVSAAPSVATGRAQLKADGTTAIPLGGTVPPPAVSFRGTVTDPDVGQTVGIQVEVKPVGAAFTGTPDCRGSLVESGTPATCVMNALLPGRYHWQLRSVDSLGGASGWVSYATNSEDAADFVLNTPPGIPTGRGQLQANGTTTIPLGGTATATTVVFRGTVADADAGQNLRLQVEVKPVGTAFTGVVSCQSAPVASGTATTCPVNSLASGESYHWRLRTVDALGTPSVWASYATNNESQADFTVSP
jgi:photosystem II stability/assembly factor-like uncharacterized protein